MGQHLLDGFVVEHLAPAVSRLPEKLDPIIDRLTRSARGDGEAGQREQAPQVGAIAGRGTIYSYTIITHLTHPFWTRRVPYIVVLADPTTSTWMVASPGWVKTWYDVPVAVMLLWRPNVCPCTGRIAGPVSSSKDDTSKKIRMGKSV